MYERIRSLMRERETNVAFMERCKIGGITNMSKWKTSAISGRSLVAIARANDTSLDWLVFGRSLASDQSAQLVQRIESEIATVIDRAYKLTSGPLAPDQFLRRRNADTGDTEDRQSQA
jgi:hypothetical protein